MLKFVVFCILFLCFAYGHENKGQNDAALQSALMPQELNPAFVSDKDSPWRVVLPMHTRQRRDADSVVERPAALQRYKLYSRLAACVALALAATLEIILYIVEFYTTTQ